MIDHVFAGLPVAEVDAARAWYERFVGRAPDLMPNDNEAAWRLTDKGWLYIVGDAQRAGAGLLTLLVDDVDEWIADLARRGLAPDAIETIPGAVREAVNVDPDGNRITVGRPLGAGG